jgi:hypothetical protein
MESNKQNLNKDEGKKRSRPKADKKVENQFLRELKQLKSDFAGKFDTVKEALNTAKSNGAASKQLDLYNSEYKFKGKLANLEKLVGEKFMTQYMYDNGFIQGDMKFAGLPTRDKIKYLSAVYADDLGSLILGGASKVMPYIGELAAEYGPQLLNWLYTKARKSLGYTDYKGHGSGPGMTIIPNVNSLKYVDMNTVDLTYIASVFCPEKFTSITPDTFSTQLVNTTKMISLPVNTGTDGNAIIYLLPDLPCSTNVGSATWFACSSAINGTVNIASGAISSGTTAYNPGPYFSQGQSNINKYRVGSLSARFVPDVSTLNNNGVASIYYATDSTNDSLYTNNPAIPQASCYNFPFQHVAPMSGLKELRQLHTPHDQSDLSLDDFGITSSQMDNNGDGGLDCIILTIEGGPAGVLVGKLLVTVGLDYMPGDTAIGLVKPIPSPNAPGSVPCAATLLKLMPHLAQLTSDESVEFATSIVNSGCTQFPDLVKHVMSTAGHYKSRPRGSDGDASAPPGPAVDEMSFDKISY